MKLDREVEITCADIENPFFGSEATLVFEHMKNEFGPRQLPRVTVRII
jgi:hypothetical protein